MTADDFYVFGAIGFVCFAFLSAMVLLAALFADSIAHGEDEL